MSYIHGTTLWKERNKSGTRETQHMASNFYLHPNFFLVLHIVRGQMNVSIWNIAKLESSDSDFT